MHRSPGMLGWLAAAALLVTSSARGGDAVPAPVTLHGDRVALAIDATPAPDAVDRLAAALGTRVVGRVLRHDAVSVHAGDLAVTDAVKRLVGAQNFSLRYGADGRLQSIVLLEAIADGSSPTMLPAVREPLRVSLGRAVKVRGSVAHAVGTPTAPLAQVFDLAVDAPDDRLRAEAMRTALDALANDPALSTDVLAALTAVDEETLAQQLRTRAGDRAGEIALAVSRQAKDARLRAQAASLLQRLTAPSR